MTHRAECSIVNDTLNIFSLALTACVVVVMLSVVCMLDVGMGSLMMFKQAKTAQCLQARR